VITSLKGKKEVLMHEREEFHSIVLKLKSITHINKKMPISHEKMAKVSYWKCG
jgi:hypothetical protein